MPSVLGFLGSVAAGGITTERAQALAVLAVGLISTVIGGLALRSAAGKGRGAPIAAMVVGVIGIALSGRHLAASTAIGTGGGRLGAIVALAMGLVGTVLGALALARRVAAS